MNDQDRIKWWEIKFASQDPEESAFLLVELGAGGVWHTDRQTLTCYFRGTAEEQLEFEEQALAIGFKTLSRSEVQDENWVQRCQEIWQPISTSTVTITPVVSFSEKPDRLPAENEIFLIPGMGFGTGHHPSTRLAIELMQEARQSGLKPLSALDLGTGSGILALACAKIFGCPVKGVDNDPEALRNAADNVSLNSLEKHIDLELQGAENTSGAFDLVIANIYAEALVKLAPNLRKLTKDGGQLVLSGIVSCLAANVRAAMEAQGFCCSRQKEEGEWTGLLFVLPAKGTER